MYFDDTELEAPEQFIEWLNLVEAENVTSPPLQAIERLIERGTGIGADLTNKQHTFALEYARTHNATQSAITSGYSAKTAAQMGYKLRHNPKVVKMIDAEFARLVAIDESTPLDQACLYRLWTWEFCRQQERRLLNLINLDAGENIEAVRTMPDKLPGHTSDAVQTTKRSKNGYVVSIDTRSRIQALEQAMKLLGGLAYENAPFQVQTKATCQMIS